MILTKKHARLLFSVFAASLFVLVPGHFNSGNTPQAATLQADGTHPPAPPIPWRQGSGSGVSAGVLAELSQPVLAADGTQPPAPPIPWRGAGAGNSADSSRAFHQATVLTADGTHPPAPPIPWAQLSAAAQA